MRIAMISIMPITYSQRAFSAEEDPASLDRLADIVTLPPVPWWPPAPGWYVVMATVLILAVFVLVGAWRHRQRNAYRGAALAELERVGQPPMALTRIAQILKRTALATMPRESVAGLSGERWLHWLDQTSSGVAFSEHSRRLLSNTLYGAGQASDKELDELVNTARAWVRRHRVTPAKAVPEQSKING